MRIGKRREIMHLVAEVKTLHASLILQYGTKVKDKVQPTNFKPKQNALRDDLILV